MKEKDVVEVLSVGYLKRKHARKDIWEYYPKRKKLTIKKIEGKYYIVEKVKG